MLGSPIYQVYEQAGLTMESVLIEKVSFIWWVTIINSDTAFQYGILLHWTDVTIKNCHGAS